MSDALIASLQKRIDDLTTQNVTLASEAKTRRIGNKKLAAELEALKATHAAAASERDAWKAKAEATPAEQSEKLAALERQVKVSAVKESLSALAGKLAPGVTLEKLFKYVEFDPAQADPASLKPEELEASWRDAAAPLFTTGETPKAAPGGAQKPSLNVTTPTGRGGSEGGSGRLTVRRSDLSDPAWMRANQSRLIDGYAAGAVDVTD